MPADCGPAYEDPRKILRSKVFHALALVVLYKATSWGHVSEHVMALVVFLLEQAILINDPSDKEVSWIICYRMFALFKLIFFL